MKRPDGSISSAGGVRDLDLTFDDQSLAGSDLALQLDAGAHDQPFAGLLLVGREALLRCRPVDRLERRSSYRRRHRQRPAGGWAVDGERELYLPWRVRGVSLMFPRSG
jgi:hypothetical protein